MSERPSELVVCLAPERAGVFVVRLPDWRPILNVESVKLSFDTNGSSGHVMFVHPNVYAARYAAAEPEMADHTGFWPGEPPDVLRVLVDETTLRSVPVFVQFGGDPATRVRVLGMMGTDFTRPEFAALMGRPIGTERSATP